MAGPKGAPERGDQQGVAFPVVDGQRSTTATAKGVFADAARAVDPQLAERIEAERDWRNRYLDHARALLEASVTTSDSATLLPSAGLASLHRRFVFERDGAAQSLRETLSSPSEKPLETVAVSGEASAPDLELSVPYKGRRLRGDDLHRQLDRWVSAGVVEPSFADAIREVMANRDWLDLSDHTVVILGAGAQMGPLHSLSRWNATLAPLDVDRPDVWGRILSTVRGGSGTALVPVREPSPAGADLESIAAVAGADLVTDMPEIGAWLRSLDGPMTVGNYVYADGAMHVRVSMAVDAITADLLGTRDDVSIAVLATPTDVFAVPEDAVAMSQRRLADRRISGLLEASVRTATRGHLYAPNYDDMLSTPDGQRLGIADCLVKQQGPNYALAKRLQRWRASVARDAGVLTSINVAPPTRTRSVMKNRALAAAYAGAHRFGVEVFDPSTSNTLMAAMLVHDLRNPKSVANPDTPVQHPLELFWSGANHGGLWRNPHAARSVLGLAVVLGMVPRGA